MCPIIDKSVGDLNERLISYAKQNQTINIQLYIKQALLEISMKTFFGIKLNTDIQSPLLIHANNILNIDVTFLKLLSFLVPEFSKIFNIDVYDQESANYLEIFANKIINERKNNENNDVNHTDFIEYLMRAQNDNELDLKGNLDDN
jgi:hypothetical protein